MSAFISLVWNVVTLVLMADKNATSKVQFVLDNKITLS